MKPFLQLIYLSLFFTLSNFAFASNAPSPVLYDLEEVYQFESLTIRTPSNTFVLVNFDEGKKSLTFEALEDMTNVQVLNQKGELEFQIPVLSKAVILDISDFSIGDYQLNISMNNDKMIPTSFSKLK